jgi:hypothetical protein
VFCTKNSKLAKAYTIKLAYNFIVYKRADFAMRQVAISHRHNASRRIEVLQNDVEKNCRDSNM